jgi:hypothetical protein
MLLVDLASVLPAGLTLYVEGTSIAPIVSAYLADRAAANPLSVRPGIIWPRPKAYHIPMTTENVVGLADLMKNLAGPEVGDHFHAYRDDVAYLIWYDAWFDSPLYLHRDVPEDAVRRICDAHGCECSPFA